MKKVILLIFLLSWVIQNRACHYYYKQIFLQEGLPSTVYTAFTDKKGFIWIGTTKGLYFFHLKTRKHGFISTSLFSNIISVVCDRKGQIWMGSNDHQLFSWSIKEQKFIIYSESDGLSANEYLNEPRLITSQGDIYIGGVQGLLHIDAEIPTNTMETSQIELVDMLINEKAIDYQVKRKAFISIPWNSQKRTIKMSSNEKDIFRKRIYRYKLEGVAPQYIESDYPELSLHSFAPSIYTFSVSCTTRNGDWASEKAILSAKVTPPWYSSWWFILLCTLIVAGNIAGWGYIIIKKKENMLKWRMKEQEQKVYEEKVRLLININHELRTPLTLIHASLKRVLQHLPDTNENYISLKGAYNQTQRMRNTIDMVLDVRKMEVGQSTLSLEPHPLNEWIKDIAKEFEMEATTRGIKIVCTLDNNIKEISFDKNKCETILINLLSNAMKYSPDNTEIQIISHLEQHDQRVRISISDQGCGLKNIDKTKLFTRFYQGDETQSGSGIGLSYAKMLAELHEGSIGAEDNEKGGAIFFFELPIKTNKEKKNCKVKPYLNGLIYSEQEQEKQFSTNLVFPKLQHYSLLLVDDNKDFTSFLKESLQSQFKRIYTAINGMEAYETVQKEHPDIVVSDIMMPHTDGYTLCKQMKENITTSHIPIILLTARNDDKSRLYGYKNGADAYIAKPFDLEVLVGQIYSILQNRENIKQRYLKNTLSPLPKEATFSNADETFLLKLNNVIAENINNPKLDVLFLCNEMGMSRSSLYSKLKITTNMAVNDYINKLRMEKAITLISSTDLTITEISEKLGFSTLRYFSTTFKQYTGKAPSLYKEDLKNNTN